MTSDEQQLVDLVRRTGRMGNQKARVTLGWSEEHYRAVRDGLVIQGVLVVGPGRGGSISLVAGGQKANKPKGQQAPKPKAAEPKATSREAERPTSSQASKPSGQNASKPTGPQAPEPMAAEPERPKAKKASTPAIDKYYTSVQKIKDWDGSHKESLIRQGFRGQYGRNSSIQPAPSVA